MARVSGTVYLVGAGPGDPKLLTLRAVEVLRKADVVIYDRLVNEKILDFAGKWAQLLYAGKEIGMDSGARQSSIIQEMIGWAKKGRSVVRLKGGDPFVFGRGGEEAIALAEAGIPLEVVPGISSAIAAPASAGIPVTHRGVSTAFAVFAGQTAGAVMSDALWQAATAIPTAVFLMGVERLPLIVAKMLQMGRSVDTPVALISNGTLPNEQVVVGTLETILNRSANVFPPCTIVVGECVGVRDRINASDWPQLSGEKEA